MSDIHSLDVGQRLASILFAAIMALIAFASAYRLQYFKLPDLKPPFIKLTDCFQVFIVFIALQFFILPLILYWAFGSSIKSGFEVTGWVNVGVILAMAFTLSLFFCLKRKEIKSFFYSKRPFWDIGVGIISWLIAFPFALLVSQMLVLILTDFLGYTLQDQNAVIYMKQSLEDPELFIATMGVVVFIVPILEEVIFRGFLQTSLRSFLPPFPAIFSSAALFSLFHFSFSQGINNVNILISLFILALFLGHIRERQGNLLPCIALHSTFNGISVAMIVFSSP